MGLWRIAAFLLIGSSLLLSSCTDFGGQPVMPVPRLTLVGDTTGEAGSIECEIRLDIKPDTPVVIILATQPGTAESGIDFTPTVDTVTIVGASGPDSARGWLIIPIAKDSVIESLETFFVRIMGASNAEVVTSEVSCTIVDDDGVPKISIASTHVFDGDTAIFDVTLNKAGLEPVVFNYYSTGGTAEPDLDFSSTIGTDTIPAGSLGTTVTVTTSGEYLAEGTEYFGMTISVLQGAEGFDVTAVGFVVQPVRYSVQIVNIMGSCAGCHTPARYASRNYYAVHTYDSLMLSGVHAPNVIPGHAEQSLLYLILLNPPPPGHVRMPPNSSLPDATIDTVKQWIDQGAKNN